mmetsp:Transcript_17932/g.12915  ORF Transcript_17932/g.12915 Transcript_17932/m.12915 type:complete len:198 (+) Transcript_17932:1633-2226(+)
MNKGLQDAIQIGHVVQGRIADIKIFGQSDLRFVINLKCKKEDLQSHAEFLEKDLRDRVPPEDLLNPNFQVEKKKASQARYQVRKIFHPKFKNMTSAQAISELKKRADVGEFIFRPSSQGPDHITLTWLFYKGCVIHIDITEHDKHPTAQIGSLLKIGEEEFENLNEIIERYIIPTNKALSEVLAHPKFQHLASLSEL